ncbi:unnamed protein product [Meloidogyne enterolobii]|uniref:Uncharacterized protein n=1 Tax=Meloidogyne enterolobii TaxID=390850 RepID=A0ACB0XTE4_MELEN
METLEAGDRNRRRKSGSNGSTNSNDTLNRQNQNLQMARIENSASVLTILLTRTQRVLIENSWKRAKKGAADGGVGSRVFHTVLTAQPDIKLLFGLEKIRIPLEWHWDMRLPSGSDPFHSLHSYQKFFRIYPCMFTYNHFRGFSLIFYQVPLITSFKGRLKYEGQFRRHASVLTRALEYIVKNVQYTDKLGIHFQALGKKHCQMNGGRAFPTHYWDTFLECIIQSLLECDGTSGGRKHRCRETAMAWRNLISFIVQQMRRGFEDERLLRKRFSASLMGIRGIKGNCIKSSGNSSERSLKSSGKIENFFQIIFSAFLGRPLVSKINHNVLHQSFGSLDDYPFPFSSNNFNDNPGEITFGPIFYKNSQFSSLRFIFFK